jgi:hypothetical protein
MIMKKKTVILFALIIISSVIFGINAFNIKLNLTIGNEEDSLLYRWVSVAVDDEGNMYVTDMLDCSLKKFDNRGNFIKKIGQRGQGPSEFTSPAIIRYCDGYLYISEQQMPGIHVFNRELNYVKKISISMPIVDFHVFSENAIMLLSLMSDGYCYVDAKGTLNKKISFKQDPSSNMFLLLKKVAVDKDNNKYLLSLFQGILEKYDKNDKHLWTIKLKNNPGELKFKKAMPGMDVEVPEKMLYKGIAIDKNGWVLVLIGQGTVNASRSIIILDPTGKQAGEVLLQEASHYLYCDKNNRIYVGRNQGTSLKVYTLEVKQTK